MDADVDAGEIHVLYPDVDYIGRWQIGAVWSDSVGPQSKHVVHECQSRMHEYQTEYLGPDLVGPVWKPKALIHTINGHRLDSMLNMTLWGSLEPTGILSALCSTCYPYYGGA